ncbi:MAG: VOC family protein [Henriciella sp.]
MTRPNGIHHLAVSTANMKEQLGFFTQVLGMELVALYWMHGVDGAWHAFCKLNDHSSIAFVFMPENAKADRITGQSHAAHGGGPSAGGTMQHLAFNVDTEDELFEMRLFALGQFVVSD